MTTDPGVCRLDDTIRDAAVLMQECDCGSVPVVESLETLRLVGIITDRDIAIRAVAKGLDPNTTPVADCMSTDVSCVNPEASITEVERIMENLQVRRVPVVTEKGAVCGMVSMADIALSRPKHEIAEVVQDVSRPSVSGHAAFLS